jgi:hypothetical protein
VRTNSITRSNMNSSSWSFVASAAPSESASKPVGAVQQHGLRLGADA